MPSAYPLKDTFLFLCFSFCFNHSSIDSGIQKSIVLWFKLCGQLTVWTKKFKVWRRNGVGVISKICYIRLGNILLLINKCSIFIANTLLSREAKSYWPKSYNMKNGDFRAFKIKQQHILNSLYDWIGQKERIIWYLLLVVIINLLAELLV